MHRAPFVFARLALALVGLGFAHARADTIRYSVPYSAPFPTINLVNVPVPQFDTLGGTRTLQGVELEFVYSPNFLLTIENQSATPQTTIGRFDLLVAGLAPGGINLSSLLLSGNIESRLLAASDGIRGSGADFADFGRIALNASRAFNVTNFSSYIGAGLFNTRMTFLGLNFIIPPIPPFNPFRIETADGRFDGAVNVTYTFVPGPGVVGLAAALGVIALRRRRGPA